MTSGPSCALQVEVALSRLRLVVSRTPFAVAFTSLRALSLLYCIPFGYVGLACDQLVAVVEGMRCFHRVQVLAGWPCGRCAGESKQRAGPPAELSLMLFGQFVFVPRTMP